MTTSIRNISNAAIIGIALIAAQTNLVAQTVVESATRTTTTTSAGIVSELSPETIVIKTESASEPVRYTYTKTTTYVDETGAPVSMELVKSGLPVTVYYVKEGDRMVASKVIVRKPEVVVPSVPSIEEKKTTTTTTTTDQ